MSDYGGLNSLVAEIKAASANIERGDARMNQRLDGIERSVNELYLRQGRPGAAWETKDEDAFERKSAVELCRNRRNLTVPKIDAGVSDNYTPTSAEVDEAMTHRRAIKALMRTGDPSRIDHTFQKFLSSFSFASTGYLLPPEMSNRVLSCIGEPTDLSGLVDRINIGAPSVRFPIDNARMPLAAWACESGCFANNPSPDLAEGLGQLEIKAESLRHVVCATSDLLADASMNVESWILNKVSEGFRATINYSILLGDGVEKPLGMLTPQSGIPICDTSASTPAGQFSWQDLVQHKYEIPMQWQDGCYFLMNQRTFALLQTMSTADGRPLFGPQGTNVPGTGFFVRRIANHDRIANARRGSWLNADFVWQSQAHLCGSRSTSDHDASRQLYRRLVYTFQIRGPMRRRNSVSKREPFASHQIAACRWIRSPLSTPGAIASATGCYVPIARARGVRGSTSTAMAGCSGRHARLLTCLPTCASVPRC